MSVPGGLDAAGLPLGLQVIGRALDEGVMFSVAAALEKAAAFRAKPDRWW
jgi:aspartyl-tRNA(Asn)/glutamyl-tRNA(Gln) amidotransferase subunit A